MGILRLLLALGVVAEHSKYPIGAGSYTAVQAFFIISGFYMAFILSQNQYSISHFYRSRMLRMFPTYWSALAIALLYFAHSAVKVH